MAPLLSRPVRAQVGGFAETTFYVYDSHTYAPIAGATVSLYNYTTDAYVTGGTTASNGDAGPFSLNNPGTYELYVSDPSYGSFGGPYSTSGAGGQTYSVGLNEIPSSTTTTTSTTSAGTSTTSHTGTFTTSQTVTSTTSQVVTTFVTTLSVGGSLSVETVTSTVTGSVSSSSTPGPIGTPVLPQPTEEITIGLAAIATLLLIAFTYNKSKTTLRNVERRFEGEPPRTKKDTRRDSTKAKRERRDGMAD
jgi:hypothetical protein